MQQTDSTHPTAGSSSTSETGTPPGRRRGDLMPDRLADTLSPAPRVHARTGFGIAALLFFIVLLALVPPYLNISRFQRRIAGSLSEGLGRPVHFDSIKLTLLPLPGFTIANLVVADDPAFSAEPIIRADEVRGTLRVSSLWRRRVEFSSISFSDPSINLVRSPSGRWNVEGVLMKAAQLDTTQIDTTLARPAANVVAVRRFPYIEATGARLNVKMGLEKLPAALTDSKLALWLPEGDIWHLRLEGHPTRTDASVTNSGILRIEGSFGRAASLAAVPMNLQAEWRNAPLGAASLLLTGADFGWRGNLTVAASITGLAGDAAVRSTLKLDSVRRSDFVPDQPPSLEADCTAQASAMFQSLARLACNVPVEGSPTAGSLHFTGSIPDVRDFSSADLDATATRVPAAALLDWLRIASRRMPAGLTASGYMDGTAQRASGERWKIDASLTQARLALGSATAFFDQDILLQGTLGSSPDDGPDPLLLHPVRLALGSKADRKASSKPDEKQEATIDGVISSSGYRLHLTGFANPARLASLAEAVPQLGDGLDRTLQLDALLQTEPADRSVPLHLNLVADRAWNGPQIWQEVALPAVHPRTRPRSKR